MKKQTKKRYLILLLAILFMLIGLVVAIYTPSYKNPSGMYNLLEYIADTFSNLTIGAVLLFILMPTIAKLKQNNKM